MQRLPSPVCQHVVVALLAPLACFGQPLPVEEVIVTARKVEENVFSVPISIAVLSGDALDTSDPTNLYELQFDVPGLVVANVGMNGAGIALRGVTDQTGQSLAVAPHFNGVYLGRSMLALSRSFDLERIEVLKGPQGTLYGRNAAGGSINVISRAPESEFSAAIESAIGSFDTLRIQGHVNFAADRLAVRLSGIGSEGNGYIHNSLDARTFAEDDYAALRASLRARPNDSLTVSLTAERMHDDGGSSELWLPNKSFLADPGNIRLATVSLANPYLSIENDLLSVDVEQDVGNGKLSAIGGYVRSTTSAIDDCGGGPLPTGCVRSYLPRSYEQRSQEIRFARPAGDRYDWLVGLYFLDADEWLAYRLGFPGAGPLNDYTADSAQEASALFSQAGVRVSERLRLTGGLRRSRETSRLTSSGAGLRDNPTRASVREAWNNTSWRVGLEYQPADYILYHANVATGFKSGGTNAERLPTGQFNSYGPEELTAIEMGAKLRLPGQRWSLQGSAFDYDFRNLQVQTFRVIGTVPVILIENAADARIHGLDISAVLDATDTVWLSGGLVWMPMRKFVDFTSAVSADMLSGNMLSRAPEWSSSLSIGYDRPIGAIGDLSLRADYAYRSEFFFTADNDPLFAQTSFGLLNLFARFDSNDDSWYVFTAARNLSDTDYFNQVFIQSSPGPPSNYELGLGFRF